MPALRRASKKRPSLHYTIFPVKEEADGKKAGGGVRRSIETNHLKSGLKCFNPVTCGYYLTRRSGTFTGKGRNTAKIRQRRVQNDKKLCRKERYKETDPFEEEAERKEDYEAISQ